MIVSISHFFIVFLFSVDELEILRSIQSPNIREHSYSYLFRVAYLYRVVENKTAAKDLVCQDDTHVVVDGFVNSNRRRGERPSLSR